MAVGETKIDCSYPDSQSLIPGYYLHQNDQKKNGGGVLLFVSSMMLSKRVTFNRSYKTVEPLALEFGLNLKKDDPHEKENYRTITVQITVNKLFEQLLSKQLSYGFNNKLCDKLTAYRKNNSCETALLSLTENWKLALDEHKVVGILSTDMSKAFLIHYTIQSHLPLKLRAYGVEESSL